MAKRYKSLLAYGDLVRIGRRFRKKRFLRVVALLESVLESRERVSVLDVGGNPSYWEALPDVVAERTDLTLLNTDDWRLKDSDKSTKANIANVVGDGCDLSQFSDKSFDIVHSNSVIEHVGSFDRMRDFASESRRVGNGLYVQTPYLWFPVEPHYGAPFVHWLPWNYRVGVQMRKGLGVYKRADRSVLDYAQAYEFIRECILLDKTGFEYLYPDVERHDEWFGPFLKSLVGVRPFKPV